MLATKLQRKFGLAAAAISFAQVVVAKAAFALVGINDMQSGALLLKASEPGKFLEAPVVASDYTTTVAGPMARTIVTQQFYNPSDQWVEGVYVFPLPDNSAVDSLKIVEGTRVIIGDVKEKQEAKAVYEAAKAKGQAAALLEQQRPNMFTNAVANIGPHEKVLVQIEYQESIHQSAGTYSLRLPLVVAPRYTPAPLVQSVDFNSNGLAAGKTGVPQPPVLNPATEGLSNPVSITVNLDAGFVLGEVKSDTHKVNIANKSENSDVVSLSGIVPADRDFELTWKAKGDAPQAGLFKENQNGHDYLLGFVTPPNVDGPAQDTPRDITFVIDNSGSMNGTSMPQAKQSLLYGLSQLKPHDLFNVIRFDDTMTNVFGGSVPASEGNLKHAEDFVDHLQANGGTEMVPPMKAALADPTPQDTTHLRQVVFVTDGEISNEQELFNTIARGRGRTRLFMVGIGSAPNTYLMTHASQLGHGTYTQIGEPKQLNERMTELFSKIGHPVTTDLKARIIGSSAKISPENLSDLYRGEPVQFTANADAISGIVEITGKIGDQPWQVKLPIDKAAKASGVAKLWARGKIDEVETSATLGQLSQDEANKAVLKVALENHLVSSQTSLVAVETQARRPAGAVLTRAEVPLNLPAGWVWESVFGETAPQDLPKLQQKASLEMGQLIKASAPSAAQPVADQVPLAAGGTDGVLMALFGLALGFIGLVLMRKKEVLA